MDPVNFEQLSVKPALLGAQLPFLVEGMSIKLQFYEGDPLSGRPLFFSLQYLGVCLLACL